MILINMLAFLYTALRDDMDDSDILLRYGASYTPYIFENHKYWRLLAAVFLHFDIRHPGDNMLVLFATGNSLERTLERMKCLILYLPSAVGTSAVSFTVKVATGQGILSAGVSGVVFVVLDGLIRVLVRSSGRSEEPHIYNPPFFSGMILLSGFLAEGVDNVARASGLLVGFLLAVVLYRRSAVTLFSTNMT